MAIRVLVPTLLSLAGLSLAFAQPAGDEYTSTLERFTATGDLSAGCTLVELDRRAGRLPQAEQRARELLAREQSRQLDAAADPNLADRLAPPATTSACHYNHGRVLADLGRTAQAVVAFGEALAGATAARRPHVERALADAHARLVHAEGSTPNCSHIGGLVEAQALLRFADLAALRACVQHFERDAPTCAPIERDALRDEFRAYGPLRSVTDAPMRIGLDAGALVLFRMQGASPRTGMVCELGIDGSAEATQGSTVDLGGGRKVIVFGTRAYTSYACDCEEDDDSGDCRCEEFTQTVHVAEPSGRILLSLVDESVTEPGTMAAPRWEGPSTREPSVAVRTDPSRPGVLLLGGRALVLRRGALVPAPAVRVAPAR